MALTATDSPLGFELVRYIEPDDVFYVPGDPGDTFTRGDMVVSTVGEGILDPGAANEGGLVGRVVETIVCPANTQAFAKPQSFDPVAKSAADLCLIPIQLNLVGRTPVYRATFTGHDDETVVSYVSATRAVEATTGAAADDYPNGGLLYVYEGPGAGEVNVVEDYDHTGGAAELLTICHRPFSATLTTSSKYIVLAGEAVASRGHGFFNRIESADEDNVITTQGADDGDWVIALDWRDAPTYLKQLTLPLIPARYLMLA